jgi:hypothetical protein
MIKKVLVSENRQSVYTAPNGQSVSDGAPVNHALKNQGTHIRYMQTVRLVDKMSEENDLSGGQTTTEITHDPDTVNITLSLERNMADWLKNQVQQTGVKDMEALLGAILQEYVTNKNAPPKMDASQAESATTVADPKQDFDPRAFFYSVSVDGRFVGPPYGMGTEMECRKLYQTLLVRADHSTKRIQLWRMAKTRQGKDTLIDERRAPGGY